MSNKFGENLSVILKMKNIRQTDLAESTGIADATISRYVKGQMEPRIDNLIAIAEALGVTVDYLIGNDKSNDPQRKLHPIDFEISSEPQWIPVSKKLPNKNDYVIVTTKYGVVIEAQFEVWNSGVKEWWIDNDNSFEFDDVVAWMPMPQPYRGG